MRKIIPVIDLQKMDSRQLSRQIHVDAFYAGTQACYQFAKNRIIPILECQLQLNKKEQAMVYTYYRMVLWMSTLVVLKGVAHFQAVAAATRALFELVLDMMILYKDQNGDFVDRFHAFPEVEKFRVAELTVQHCNQNRGKTRLNDIQRRRFLSRTGRRSAIQNKKVKYWGKNKKGQPKKSICHWTGKNVKTRAKELSFEYLEEYLETYPIMSWHLHSGSTGYAGLDKDSFQTLFALCHSLAQRSFLNATRICAKEFCMSLVIDNLDDILQSLKLKPGEVLLEEHIRILNESRGR